MSHAIAARRATWTPIMKAVVQTVGFTSPLHRAALEARLGKDPGGATFAAIAARLSAGDRRRLWSRVETLEAECSGSECTV